MPATATRATRSSSKPATTRAVKHAAKVTKKLPVKPATKPASKPKIKEADDDAPPPAKRQKKETDAPKPKPKSADKEKEEAKAAPKLNGKAHPPPPAPKVARPKKPYLNPLPTPPEHPRPPNQIFIWGAGNFGQFGMGPEYLDQFEKPKKNAWIEKKIEDGAFGPDGAGIEAVAAGGLHTMFVDETGKVWTCGVNDDAALGRITKDVPDENNPGSFHNVDILTSFPHPLDTLVAENFRAVTIAAGDSISAAISDEGELRVWGSFRGNEGALGFSDGSKFQYLPAPILHLPTRDDERVSSVAAGNNHLVVLTTHGHIYTWGAGEQGQLGRKIIERRKIHGTTPEKVVLGHHKSRKAVAVGAGNYTSFAVDEEGSVWGWGLNNMGQTGTGYEDPNNDGLVLLPQQVLNLDKEELGGARVVKIAGGEHHTLFLTSDGRVFACGRSNAGQLGLPSDHAAFKDERPSHQGLVAEPTTIPFPEDDDPIIHISAGTHNNMAVTADGALFAWGDSTQGELGTGDEMEVKTPKMVVRREGGSWKAIATACGGQHTLGLFRKKA